MKKTTVYLCVALALLSTIWGGANAQNSKLSGTITVSGAYALYPMAVKWADEFKKINPNVKINLSTGGSGKGMSETLLKSADIGMISREVTPAETTKGAYPIAVTRDAVVVIISASNFILHNILGHGITKSSATDVFTTFNSKNWKVVNGTLIAGSMRIYTRADVSGDAEVWAKYLGKKQEDLVGIALTGAPFLVQNIIKDPSGIGYCSSSYAYDPKTKHSVPGIRILSLDLNSNSKIDPNENISDNLNDLIYSISSGTYPAPLSRDLYFVTNGKSTNPIVQEFIKYVLTDGQKFVFEAGYVGFAKSKLEKELLKLK